jgi:hypothetical protein
MYKFCASEGASEVAKQTESTSAVENITAQRRKYEGFMIL